MSKIPIPSPSSNEDDKTFLSRCMGDSVMNKEYPDNKQRSAICYGQLKKSKENISGKNLDEQGRIIIAENVKLIFNCTIGERK